MQSWLPTLERKLEVAAESGHDDFRCYLSAEPPPLHDQQTIPEGILQAAINPSPNPSPNPNQEGLKIEPNLAMLTNGLADAKREAGRQEAGG